MEKRIAKQIPQEEMVKLSDFVIVNDGEEALTPQIFKIHRALAQL